MNTRVSYGALAPAMIGGLGVVVNALLAKGRRGEAPVSLKRLPNVIEFSDSGIWGDNSLDPDVEPRVFRVSDFDGDFRLDYSSAPPRAIPPDRLAKFQLQRGDMLVVKSSGSANQVVSGRVAVFDMYSKQPYAASNFTLRLRPRGDIDPHYLAFVLGSPPVREAVADSVKTMTYPNLSFRIYSAIEVPVIPLPDQKLVGAFFNALLNRKELPALPSYLAEQRRVVARIEELAAQIHEARTLRHQATEEAEALLRSLITHDKQAYPTPMRELIRLRSPDVTVRADETYQFAGVYCFGRGVFKSARKSGMDFAYPRLTRLRAGDFVYPKLMAWEGALGIVPPECHGCVVSTEFPVFEVNEDRVIHEVIDTYFRTPSVWPEIASESTGTNVRRRRLNPEDFLDYEMPLPSRETQMTLRMVRAEVDVLKRLQAETAQELDALLPAILDRAFNGEL